jgi:hypothetical protein
MSTPAEITERIAAIRQRVEAATPGPWVSERAWDAFRTIADCGHLYCVNAPQTLPGPPGRNGATDAELIAHAPEDLRWALDQLEAAQRDTERLDWLDSHAPERCVTVSALPHRGLMRGHRWTVHLNGIGHVGSSESFPPSIREAIDAARSSSRGETQP